MLKYISIKVFIISFIVGLIFVYFFGSETKKIYVYPTPQNIGQIQYKDSANNCFHYESKEVKCPSDDQITSVPAQV
jgi:hypothetical protein